MKLSFPTRFPMPYVLASAGVMFAASWAEGTDVSVAVLAAAFLVLTALAFNAAGGLIYPSGAYIFFVATLDLGIGMVSKVFLGEPLESHVSGAAKSFMVYDVGMLTLYGAAVVNRRLRRQRPLLLNVLTNSPIDQVSMGCIIIGLAGPLVIPDGLLSMFNQINHFMPFAVMLPVYARTKETNGASSFSWIAFFAWLYMTVVFGLLTFSKQGIYEGSAAWAVAALAAGYRISKIRLIILTVVALGASAILTPYSQVGRQFRGTPDLVEQGIYLLQHPLETRAMYEMQTEIKFQSKKTEYHWFDHPAGILDRLTMFPIDDALITRTDQGHSQTFYVFVTNFMNAIPHFLAPDKPNILWGNEYAHEIGLLSAKDFTTSIAFSPFADTYHVGQWLAMFTVAPLMFLILFVVVDSVAGATSQTVWALFYILYFTHAGPEGLMGITVYAWSTMTFGLILAAFSISRIAPLIGQLVTLPKPITPQSAALKP